MASVTGLTGVVAALRKAEARHAKGAERGLKLGGIEILRSSQKYVPVDLGDLKATGHVRHTGAGFGTVVIIGYGMVYAAWVHEDLEKAHGEAYNVKYATEIAAKAKYWYKGGWRQYHNRGKGQTAKFLSKAVDDNRDKVVAIVKAEAVK